MIFLNKEQIVASHSLLIKESSGMDGLRDENLLESAINAPFQTFAGDELSPIIQKKAECYCYGHVINHAFIEGDKCG